jgi:hypothetical protein
MWNLRLKKKGTKVENTLFLENKKVLFLKNSLVLGILFDKLIVI